ncbi:hypothetical protein FAGKG844_580021 [Frankia sp. AgKG'84/4]
MIANGGRDSTRVRVTSRPRRATLSTTRSAGSGSESRESEGRESAAASRAPATTSRRARARRSWRRLAPRGRADASGMAKILSPSTAEASPRTDRPSERNPEPRCSASEPEGIPAIRLSLRDAPEAILLWALLLLPLRSPGGAHQAGGESGRAQRRPAAARAHIDEYLDAMTAAAAGEFLDRHAGLPD